MEHPIIYAKTQVSFASEELFDEVHPSFGMSANVNFTTWDIL
jgi:hypothetical protein